MAPLHYIQVLHGAALKIARMQKVLGPQFAKKSLLKYRPEDAHQSWGCCYPAAEALWHLWGKKVTGLVPCYLRYEVAPGVFTTHWFLRATDNPGFAVDPTFFQFSKKIKLDYRSGTPCGFLTKQPSKRAQQIMKAMTA